ncbi:MAG: DUF6798 domain-containing protein [Bacteroidota bacterium]
MRALPRSANPSVAVWLLLAVACYWRLGVAYGVGDHEELVPQLLRLLDPTLFPRDPYLLAEDGHFSVRFVFLGVLRGLAVVVGPEAAVVALTAASWAGIAWAAYRLAFTLVPSRAAATLTVLATLVTIHWTPGGNGLLSATIAPEPLAWVPCLLAVEAFLRDRSTAAAVLLGVAAWLHPLMGLQVGLLLGLVALWQMADGEPRRAFGRAVLFGVTVFVVASPILLPTLLTQAGGEPIPDDGLSTFRVTAELRQAHHYLLFSQPASGLVRYGLVVAAGLVGLVLLRRRGGARHVRMATRVLTVIAGLVVVYVGMTEGAESLTVAKMQFFRLLVLAKLVLLAWACGAAVALVPASRQAALARLADRRGLALAASGVLVALTVALAVADVGRPGAMWKLRDHTKSDLYRVERWIEAETPRDAVFLVPPSMTAFRAFALRSVAINFKPTTFRDAAMHRWLARIRAVAPTPLPPRGGLDWQADLDRAYHAHSAASWARVAATFEADYALVDTRLLRTPPTDDLVAEAGPWAVYRFP